MAPWRGSVAPGDKACSKCWQARDTFLSGSGNEFSRICGSPDNDFLFQENKAQPLEIRAYLWSLFHILELSFSVWSERGFSNSRPLNPQLLIGWTKMPEFKAKVRELPLSKTTLDSD